MSIEYFCLFCFLKNSKIAPLAEKTTRNCIILQLIIYNNSYNIVVCKEGILNEMISCDDFHCSIPDGISAYIQKYCVFHLTCHISKGFFGRKPYNSRQYQANTPEFIPREIPFSGLHSLSAYARTKRYWKYLLSYLAM